MRPCHGVALHDMRGRGEDEYPQGHHEDVGWDVLFRELQDKRINYLFLKIKHHTDLMFQKFKEMFSLRQELLTARLQPASRPNLLSSTLTSLSSEL